MGVELLGYLSGFLYMSVELLIIAFFTVKIAYKNLHVKEIEELLMQIEEHLDRK